MHKPWKSGMLASLAGLLLLSACKKDKDVQAPVPPPSPVTVSAEDKLKDSALLYTKDIFCGTTRYRLRLMDVRTAIWVK